MPATTSEDLNRRLFSDLSELRDYFHSDKDDAPGDTRYTMFMAVLGGPEQKNLWVANPTWVEKAGEEVDEEQIKRKLHRCVDSMFANRNRTYSSEED